MCKAVDDLIAKREREWEAKRSKEVDELLIEREREWEAKRSKEVDDLLIEREREWESKQVDEKKRTAKTLFSMGMDLENIAKVVIYDLQTVRQWIALNS